MENDTRVSWKIQDLWNEIITEDRVPQKRDYIRASDIGRPFLDRYYQMHGEPYTNPFEARILRVFDCGNIFETLIIERIFRVLGLLKETQSEIIVKKGNFLPVVGHHDPRVGGKIDVEASEKILTESNEPEWFLRRTRAFRDAIIKKYPDGIKEVITEIKTVNSRAFWAHKNIDEATGYFLGYPHHKLQLLTYLIGTNLPEGRLFYISKDDLSLMETPVFRDNQALQADWELDVRTMSEYFLKKETPPKEPDIVFNKEKGEYELNWKVGRSNYLTKITGFKNAEEWEAYYKEELKRKNKSKCKDCKKTFTLSTLNKYSGFCGRCSKKQNGGEDK